ncbi:MAG: DUF523 domain-containing protein [Planctomycetaceae bacterium]|nr:DUF523 domain-containing protein [Planctomycetaceae bacterium]
MKILVSACLMGRPCKYSGGHNFRQAVADLAREHELVEVCPEVMGGRSIPRKCIEIRNGRFVEADGTDVDAEVRGGVCLALEIAKNENVELAVLKSRSPTCGVHQIYDGTFSGTLIDGRGALTEGLEAIGVRVIDDEDLLASPEIL